MDFQLSKEQELIQKTARDFAEKYVAPVAEQIDRENKVPPEIYRKMSELETLRDPLCRRLRRDRRGVFLLPPRCRTGRQSLRGSCPDPFGQHAGDQRDEHLWNAGPEKALHGPCCRGEKIASFAFTEPGTGSDPKQITSTAVKDGDSYILNGTKRFISAADLPGPIVIFAKDDETNLPTGFIVEKFCPGYSISETLAQDRDARDMMVDVYVKDVRVPATDMLGPKGQGYWVLQAGIAYGKVGVKLREPGGNAGRPGTSGEIRKGKTAPGQDDR